MNAIQLLKGAGLNRAAIASGVQVTPHMVGMYERFERFPSGAKFAAIVQFAEQHGITLAAADFLPAQSRQRTNRKNKR